MTFKMKMSEYLLYFRIIYHDKEAHANNSTEKEFC